MKTGVKTSEFWVLAATSLAGLANQSGLLGGIVLPIESIAVMAGLVATYILSRGLAKLNNK